MKSKINRVGGVGEMKIFRFLFSFHKMGIRRKGEVLEIEKC